MQNNFLTKGLIVAIIVLFICLIAFSIISQNSGKMHILSMERHVSVSENNADTNFIGETSSHNLTSIVSIKGISNDILEGYFCNCEYTPIASNDVVNLVNNKQFNAEKRIVEIQKAIEENNASWTAGYTSMTNFSMIGLGCLDEVIEENNFETVTSNGPLPQYFDWRDIEGNDWTTPIKNQQNCGSCVAFGAIGALEAMINIEYENPDIDVDLSEAHLFFCGGGTCEEGWYQSAATDYIKFQGVPDEACFPYAPYDMSCSKTNASWRARAVKANSIGVVTGTENIQYALLLYGPLITSFTVYEDFNYYTSGIYEHVSGSERGGHCVTIVGYDNNLGYWICKNSWGLNWGENGWFRIKYGNCGIGKEAHYLSDIDGNIPPIYPSNPFPMVGAINLDTNIVLSWSSGDSNLYDTVSYDIFLGETSDKQTYIGTSGPFPASQQNITYDLGTLENDTHYYWKVIAKNNFGSITTGSVWDFQTKDTTPPSISFIDPLPGWLYIYGKRYSLVFPQHPIIIGFMTLKVEASDSSSGMKKVQFYINDKLKFEDYVEPYEWLWNGLNFFKTTIKVVGYDQVGNIESTELVVRKLF